MEEGMNFKGYVTVKVKKADGTEEVICERKPNLVTTVGVDWQFLQLYNAGTVNEAIYVAVSSNATPPAVGDSSLTGEIVTSGLTRAAGTPAHVAGTATATITKVFTATGSHTAVQKTALFTEITGGVMVHENSFPACNLEDTDQLTVIWTITNS